MRIRKISVLVDGGFFYKRIKDWPTIDREDPKAVADTLRYLCKRHVQVLTGEANNAGGGRWLDHVYRLFYYDAKPYDGAPHHPFLNRQVKFNNSPEANFRRELFNEIRKKRKFALRLGVVAKKSDRAYWTPRERHLKELMKIWHQAEYLHDVLNDPTKVDPDKSLAAIRALDAWKSLPEDGLEYPLQQKGVDMRIGLDITTMTLKRQVDTIVLVTGDSDFIPAAKVARREGVEFILDPMWQSVEDDLLEHIDGLKSGLDPPDTGLAIPNEND